MDLRFLIPVILAIANGLIAIASFYESNKFAKRFASVQEAPVGIRMRKLFFGFVCLACFSRSVSLVLEEIYDFDHSDCTSSIKFCFGILFIPDIFFSSVYGVLISHWIVLLFSLSGFQYKSMIISCITMQIVIYIITIGIYLFSTINNFSAIIFCFNGILFSLLLIFIISFGIAIIYQMPKNFVMGKKILYRMLLLGFISTIAMLLEVIFYFGLLNESINRYYLNTFDYLY